MPPRKKQRVDINEADSSLTPAGHSQPTGSQQDGPRRMVTRAAARGAIQTQAPENRVAKPKKKATTNVTVRIQRRGRLQTLPDLPVEIQLEIYSYLEPRDLLLLSRLCKQFHAFFLTRHLTESLWAQARLNSIDLPPRPSFMSEPAFIRLLYSPYCQRCACPNVKPIWGWLARYCSKCVDDVSHDYEAVEYYFGLHAREPLPRSQPWERWENPLISMFYVYEPSNKNQKGHWRYRRVLVAHIDRVIAEWNADKETKWKPFVRAQEKRLREQLKSAEQCEAWFKRQEDQRLAALDAVRDTRFHDIVERLKESGWDEELEFLGPRGLEKLSKMPLVRQAAKLTPKAWENVRGRIDGFLTDTRRRLDEKKREAVLRPRFAALETAIRNHYVRLPRTPDMEARPHYIDFVYSKECRALLDAPGSHEVAPTAFDALLPTLAKRWEAKQKKDIRAALKDRFPRNLPKKVDLLNLAVTITTCQHTSASYGFPRPGRDPECPIHFPAILGHWCMRGKAYGEDLPFNDVYGRAAMCALTANEPDSDDEDDEADENNEIDSHKYRVPFHAKSLDAWISRFRMSSACRVVEALGLDPMRATIADMRKCENMRLLCTTCSQYVKPRKPGACYTVHTWKSAIRHAMPSCGNGDNMHDTWKLVDEKVMPAVCEVERQDAEDAFSTNSRGPYNGAEWCCSLCLDYSAIGPTMATHLQTEHGIEPTAQCIEDGTIFADPISPKTQWYAIRPPARVPASAFTAQ